MTWFKVDDGFAFHPKAIMAGNAALGLWVRAGAWCGANLTDGALPKNMIGTFGAQARDAKKLVAVGLWVETESGYQFHGWDEMQPSKADVEADRAANRKRQQEWRDRKRNAVTDGVTDSVTDDVSNDPPTRPDPFSSSKEEEARSTSLILCELLADLIEANGSLRPTITKAWLDEGRRLLDLDKRDAAKAENLIRWSQDDSFWRKNILSMPKFRKQYDKIRLDALEAWGKNKSGLNPDGVLDPDAILGRDRWQLPAPPEDLPEDQYIPWAKQQRDAHDAERIEEAKRRTAA